MFLCKLSVLELEERTKKLEEAINSATSSEPSSKSYQSLENVAKTPERANSLLNSPPETIFDDLPRPVSAPPILTTERLGKEASTRLKHDLKMSNRDYEKLSKYPGINVASISTVKRLEANIFDVYYRNSRGPDFYGLIEAAVDKHDFSQLPYIRITICGDKGLFFNVKYNLTNIVLGGDSVKICFFFNDIPYALSVKKLICVHTFVGDESREMLEAVMKLIDDDIAKLLQNGITVQGVKKDIIL